MNIMMFFKYYKASLLLQKQTENYDHHQHPALEEEAHYTATYLLKDHGLLLHHLHLLLRCHYRNSSLKDRLVHHLLLRPHDQNFKLELASNIN